MNRRLITKIFVIVLTVMLFSEPFLVSAQLGGVVHDPKSNISRTLEHIKDVAADTAKIGGINTDAAANTAHTGIATFDATQKGTRFEALSVEQAFSVSLCIAAGGGFFTELLDSFGSALASAGDQTKTTGTFFISKKLSQLVAEDSCLGSLYAASERVVGATDRLSAEVTAKRQNFLTEWSNVKQRITALQEQQRSSLSDIFKALSVSIVLELNKNLTTKVVNDLKDKYKIGGYLSYGNALVNQVYAIDYIKNNYSGDKEKQLILSSLLKSRSIPGPVNNNLYFRTAQAMIDSRTKRSCPTQTTLSNWNQTSWYETVSRAGAEACDRRAQYDKFNQEVDKVLASAKQSATTEIQASNGFKATRSCTNATTEVKNREQAFKDAMEAKDKAAATLSILRDAYNAQAGTDLHSDQLPNTEEYRKAEAAVKEAEAKVADLSKKVSPLTQLCNAINSPGSFLSENLNSYLTGHLEQTFNIKSENLPLYARILSKYTSNFISKILLGEKPGDILREDGEGLLGAGISAATNAALDATTAQGNQGPAGARHVLDKQNMDQICALSGDPNTRGQVFKISWDLRGVDNGQSVVITPSLAGLPANPAPITGISSICLTQPITLEFDVYDGSNPPRKLEDNTLPITEYDFTQEGNTVDPTHFSVTKTNQGNNQNLYTFSWNLNDISAATFRSVQIEGSNFNLQSELRTGSVQRQLNLNPSTAHSFTLYVNGQHAGSNIGVIKVYTFTIQPTTVSSIGGRVAGVSAIQPRGPASSFIRK